LENTVLNDFRLSDIEPEKTSFELLLDETCERLSEKQSQYIIGRIDSLEEKLASLEKCLDGLLKQR